MSSGSGASLEGDLPPEDFRDLAHEVADWIADYLAGVGDLRVFPAVEPGAVRAELPESPPQDGEPIADVLRDFRDVIVPGITHWNHPAFFGYFAITGSGPGILGEMLAAALNVNAMVWRASPAATELEELTTDWLRQLLGLPEHFEGVINDTASSSSLYALAAARGVAYPAALEQGLFGQPQGRVYVSDQTHSSIEKAVLTLGLGRNGYRIVPTDDRFQMSVDALRRALAEDVAAGVRPVAIVATLGTTSSASTDPVRDIAEIARAHDVWLHVDAAYGGPAAIVPELRPLLDGWELADSIVVNPHKWLFTPVDCSILYCRRPADLLRAFQAVPEYLASSEQRMTRNLMDYGVSLGRRFRALKLWFVLRYFGRAGIVARLRSHVRMAQDFAEWIRVAEGWELAAPQQLSLVVFRYAPESEDGAAADHLNRAILEEVNASGEAFMTHTVLDGRVALRLSIGNLKTTREHLSRTWDLLRFAATAQRATGG